MAAQGGNAYMVGGDCAHCQRHVVVIDNTEETQGAPIYCRRCAFALSRQVDDLFKSLQAAIGAAKRRKGGSA